MRILLLTSMVPDAAGVGAMPKLFHAQLCGLRERHDVTLLASFGEDPGQAEAAHTLAADLDAHFVDRRRSPSAAQRWRTRAELATTWARRPWPWRVVCGAAGLQPELDRLAATRDFDLVAVEDNPLAVLRLPSGVPTVLTEHEAVRAPTVQLRAARLRERPSRAVRAIDWRRWDAFLPAVWRRFDLLQVYCQGDAEVVRQQAPNLAGQVRINPYGMDLPPPCDPVAEEAGTILFTGTFAHLPNRDAAGWLVKEILPAIRQRQPEARLRLVGSSPPREIRELAGPDVELIADAPEMRPHLDAASVVVAPVRSGGGMRIKVLEAMAAGRPVVTTPLGAEGFDVLNAKPPLAIAADTGGLAARTAELLADPDGRRELARRAREAAERWHTPRPWAERLETVYQEARNRQQRLAG